MARTGWSTVPLVAPDAVLANVSKYGCFAVSLESIMAYGKPGLNSESAFHEGIESKFELHATGLPDVSANWELGGTGVEDSHGRTLRS